MTYSGFEAAPAGFAAAAPRIAQAAEGQSAADGRIVGELEGQGPFRGRGDEFGHGYLSGWRDTADLAAECERALRAMAAQLTDASTAYQRTDSACPESSERRALGCPGTHRGTSVSAVAEGGERYAAELSAAPH